MNGKQFSRAPYNHRANSQDYWLATDSFELWKKDKNNPFSSRDVIYKFNNYGFRCDDFEEHLLNPYRILFAGCSYTEGVGLPLEQTWTKILHSNLCERLNLQVPFWSIGAAASSTDHVTRNFNYFYNMLRPQIVIYLVPYLERRERWMGDFFNAISPETQEYKNNNRIMLDQKYVNYQTEKNFVMMDLMLKSINSQAYLIFLDKDYNVDYMNLEYMHKVDVDIDFFRNRKDLARDKMHPGPIANLELAEILTDKMLIPIKEAFNVSRI